MASLYLFPNNITTDQQLFFFFVLSPPQGMIQSQRWAPGPRPTPSLRLQQLYFGYQIKRFARDGFGSNNLPEFSQKIYDNADDLKIH